MVVNGIEHLMVCTHVNIKSLRYVDSKIRLEPADSTALGVLGLNRGKVFDGGIFWAQIVEGSAKKVKGSIR